MKTEIGSKPRLAVFWGLCIAILAIAWASILVRWCGETPALTISFYRMFWSTVIFAAVYVHYRRRGGIEVSISPKRKLMIAGAGVLLALHFAAWIAALKFTIIAHATILSSVHPAFALLLSPLLLKEKSSWRTGVAAMITLGGISLIAGQDLFAAGGRLTGDLLAIAAAIFITFYLFIARYLRDTLSLIPYLLRVYGVSALVLLVFCLVLGVPLGGHSWQTHLFMFLLAAVPTGIGHTLLNWASRKIPVYKVNIAALGEPILAAFLAFPLFGELPYGWFYAGAALVITGIVMALRDR